MANPNQKTEVAELEQLKAELAKARGEIAEHIKARTAAMDLVAKATAAAAEMESKLEDARDELDSVKTHAQAEIDRLKAKAGPGPQLAKGELAPEHKGRRHYKLTAPAFREGQWVPAGRVVCLTDRKPNRAMKPCNPDGSDIGGTPAEAVESPEAKKDRVGRPSGNDL